MRLHDLGVDAKTHMSAIEDTVVELFAPPPAAVPEAPPVPAAPAKPTPPPGRVESVPPRPATAAPAAKSELPKAAGQKTIHLRASIVVKDFADQLGMRPNQVIAELMGMNVLASINERIETSIARKLAEKHGFVVELDKKAEHKPVTRKGTVEVEEEDEDPAEQLVPRPAVVTMLGHVDHGKTSLLDRIRDASVAKGESGGITQHIGAYTVDVAGRGITFLDTPGHAAFTAMRARGANLTDIAIIVVAADDGIMPQTREAIQHARAAEVTMIVAINKTDLPAANVDRVLQQLQAEGLSPEEWGGDVVCCKVSAQTGAGIDHLLEMILLQAEMLELKANPHRRASGFVIEARLEPGMGPTANLLVTRGTLKVGDALLCGTLSGRVRALISDHGVKIKQALPSMPVKCLGLPGVPEAGASWRVCTSDKIAKIKAQEAKAQIVQQPAAAPRRTSIEQLFGEIEGSDKLELKIILKTDTQGSVEAITHALQDIKSEKVALRIILGGIGNITVNDVNLASASHALILGFHVATESDVHLVAKREDVPIRLHQVIYELIDQVREAMTGLLAPVINERVTGRAEVKQIFNIGKQVNIAGCMVTQGSVSARARVRVLRKGDELFKGAILTLKHFQDTVSEVREGQECGIRLAGFVDYEEGDVLEFYELDEIKQSL